MRLSVLSNINLDSLVGRLSKLNDVYKTEGYGTWVQEIINPNSGLYSFGPQAVFIIIDGEEMFKGQSRNNSTIDMNINYIEETVKNNPDITFFVSNIDLWTRKIDSAKAGSKERGLEFLWEDGLFLLSRKYRNLYVFDLKSIVEDIGREQFYSKKLWYLGGIKFSMKAEKVLEQYINRCVDSVKGKRKKCMVLDLDNTLWGGVVGEVGMEGIELSDYKEGARYKDFQKKLKEIKDLGIILAVVSKNNFDDAIKVIREHKHMVLKEEDFVALKINWDLKSQNIKDLSEELNIGLDSIVFIDDNPVERESVKRELPEVTVPGFPQDTSELLNFAVELYHNYFYTLDITDEDTVKTEIYRQNMKRRDAQKSSASYEDFLKSLETKIEIRRISAENVQRAAQLTQKTNQFNLTTKRYSEQELLALIDEEGFEGFVAYVSDRFGDNGMVSVVITKRKTDTEIELDTFLLSCRVMGRFIEEQIIGFIEDLYKKSGYKRLVTYYKPTEKNAPVKDFFERLGYSVLDVDSAGNKKYILDLEKSSIDSRKKFGGVDDIMRIHHLGYAVKSMDVSIEEFVKLGYERVGETVADEARGVMIQFMNLGNYCIELVAPMNAASSINGIITKLGNTPYHICYSVDNIDEAVERLKNEGYVLMEKPSCAIAIDSNKVAFLYNKHMGIIELVEENEHV